MNILHVTLWFPSKQNPVWGKFVEKQIKAVASISGNHHILSINAFQKSLPISIKRRHEVLLQNCQLCAYDIGCINWKVPFNALPLLKLIASDFLKRQRRNGIVYDLVHAHVLYPAGLVGRWISKQLGAPFVITEHWSEIKTYLAGGYFRREGRLVYQDAKAIMPVSRFLAGMVESVGVSNERIKVIPNVVDNEEFKYKPKEFKQHGSSLRFVSVMTIKESNIPTKRPDLAINALQAYSERHNIAMSLDFIGSTDDSFIDRNKRVSGLLKVNFHGSQDSRYIANLLQESDFLIHPTEVETFSIVIAEALKTGTPVIASNVGAIPELIDADSGVLCENTIEDWVMAITAASKYRFDHALIAEKNKNKFNAKDIGNQLYCTYQSIIGSA